jgi:type III pantothenate kinase
VILLVDTGNSRIKWSTLHDGVLSTGEAVAWVGADLPELLEGTWGGLRAVRAIWVVNVSGPQFEADLDAFAQRRFALAPRYVRSAAVLGGVRNGYAVPERLGADRLLAMIAAHRAYDGPVVVVDCGTAVTVDFVDASGSFRGGVIAPGLGLMRAALNRGTHALAPVEQPAGPTLALSTEAAIASGCLAAIVGLIVMIVDEVKTTTGRDPKCLLTGGDAPRLIPKLSLPCHHDPDLVLRGLAIVANEAS